MLCDDLGRPIHPETFFDRFNAAVKGSGVRRITSHGLRHTHATALIRAKESPTYVQRRLGHADVTITLAIYSHVFPQDGAAVAARFADRMRQQHRRERVAALSERAGNQWGINA